MARDNPGVVEPALVEILCKAVGTSLPNQAWDRVDGGFQLSFGSGQLRFAAPEPIFGELSVLDVVCDAVPFRDRAIVAAERDAADGVPSVYSVRSAQPPFKRTRAAIRQRGTPCTVTPGHIVSMNKWPSAIACIFQGQSGVILPCLIDKVGGPIRIKGDDHCGDRVDRELKFASHLRQLGLAAAQFCLQSLVILV